MGIKVSVKVAVVVLTAMSELETVAVLVVMVNDQEERVTLRDQKKMVEAWKVLVRNFW